MPFVTHWRTVHDVSRPSRGGGLLRPSQMILGLIGRGCRGCAACVLGWLYPWIRCSGIGSIFLGKSLGACFGGCWQRGGSYRLCLLPLLLRASDLLVVVVGEDAVLRLRGRRVDDFVGCVLVIELGAGSVLARAPVPVLAPPRSGLPVILT